MALYPQMSGGIFPWSDTDMREPKQLTEDQKMANRLISERTNSGNAFSDAVVTNMAQDVAANRNVPEVIGALADGFTGETRNIPQEAGQLSLTPPQNDERAPAQDVPDATQDPGGFIAATMGNRSMGRGNMMGMPEMPKVPTIEEQGQKMEMEKAKQVMFDQNKIPDWKDSKSLRMGLVSFGLNLLAGNDLAVSFSAAGDHFEKGFAREKREAWANDLVEQGFDAQDIQRWIETGDNKALQDPMEKQMKMIQYQTAAENLGSLKRANSPEMQRFNMEMQMYPLQLQQMQIQQSQANADRNYALAAQKAEDKRMADAGYMYDPRRKGYVKGVAGADTPEYKESLAKAQNQYIRGRQGMENYDRVVKELGGVDRAYPQQGTMSDMYDAVTIEGVFSGNQVSETIARKMNPNTAKLITQEREFLAPLLRKDSGAAISQGEWKTTGEIYFPRPGDSAETRKRKADSRNVAVLAMAPQASPELKNALDMYTTGQLNGLKVVNKRVYANDGRGWFEIQQ